jgi:voltage-gated potassium channel
VRAFRGRSVVYLLRRVWKFLLTFVGVWIVAAVLFYLTDQGPAGGVTFGNAVYWSIVTLGTVGYGDIVPTTALAKAVASALIVTQIFLLGYLLTVVTSTVTEEAQRRAVGTYGTELEGHVVVLGHSAVGAAAVRELLVQDQKVAVVVERPDQIANLRALAGEDRLFVTHGSPAERAILERTNLERAHSVIVCTDDDATNMIASLNIRAMNPRIRVVVSVARPELRETLRGAGVTFVASPSDMGGRLCASAAFEPDVATALEEISAADVKSDIREYLLRAGSPLVGRTFAEADAEIRRATGCLLIGYARPHGNEEFETFVNPPFDTRLAAGDAVILVATIANAKRSEAWFGQEQGR